MSGNRQIVSDVELDDDALRVAMTAALAQQKFAHPEWGLLTGDEDDFDLLTAAITAYQQADPHHHCDGDQIECWVDAMQGQYEQLQGTNRYLKETMTIWHESMGRMVELICWLSSSLERNANNYNRKMFYGLREVRMSVPDHLKETFDGATGETE